MSTDASRGAPPPWSGAAEIAAAVREGRTTALAVTEAHLARIAARDPALFAFVRVCGDEARARARALDEAHARGEALGPLAGVPVGVKDAIVTRGVETTAGSRILAGWRPPYDATVVERLEAAGAVVIGKCNMDEFAMGSSTESSAYGPTRNPWDTERVPGGSSGGSAVAVAADLCPLALGTDTGGSIRQPASLSGCVGLRPTYGRVSRHGVVSYASSLDQVGPLSRSVADCALALEVLAGFDPLDATSIDAPVPRYTDACRGEATRSLAGLRVGVPVELFGAGLEREVESLVRAAIARLADLGAAIVEVRLPHAPHAIAAYYVIACAEASSNLARYDGVRYGLRDDDGGRADLAAMYRRTRTAGFGAETRLRILLGTFALRSGYHDELYVRAQRVRALVQRDFREAFARCDVLAGPVSPVPAFRLGERRHDPLEMYLADACTVPSNLAGLPGISVPCGLTAGRLPIGLQLIAPALGEEVLLRTAAAWETAGGIGSLRPPFPQ